MLVPEYQLPGAIVTGSSGFLGSHLCAHLAATGLATDRICGIDVKQPATRAHYRHVSLDIRCLNELRSLSATLENPKAVFHLAAEAEVLTPWEDLADLLATNLNGTYNVLEALRPDPVLFTSTSSIYGDSGDVAALPIAGGGGPLCLYGSSKATGEMLLREWVRRFSSRVIVFRLGNVVGRGCRGIVRYLAEHAVRHPRGDVPARLRGQGRLVRDYVPVEFVTRLMTRAAGMQWPAGTFSTFNVASGRGITNAEVTELVEQVASDFGVRLTATFSEPRDLREAEKVVLAMESTSDQFEIEPPSPEQVHASILDGARSHFQLLCV